MVLSHFINQNSACLWAPSTMAPAPARHKGAKLVLALAFLIVFALPCRAREQWQIHGPNDPAPTAPIGGPPLQAAPGGQSGLAKTSSQANPKAAPQDGLPTTLPANFWQNQMTNRIAAGTVLSGILEDNLSSKKSKSGDIFSIRLQDGFTINDSLVIPQNSKIVGTVLASCPAALQRNGMPGTIQVSLQTLVMPNGRHVRFFGTIQVTPELNKAHNPTSNFLHNQANGGGRMVSSFFGFLSARAGFAAFTPRYTQTTSGMEFVLEKGEVLPIRLTHTLIVPPQVVAANQAYANAQSPLSQAPMQQAPMQNSPLSQAQAGTQVPAQVPQAGKSLAANPYPGFLNPQRMGQGQVPGQAQVPGLVGPDPDANPNFAPGGYMTQAPGYGPNGQYFGGQARNMPDPF